MHNTAPIAGSRLYVLPLMVAGATAWPRGNVSKPRHGKSIQAVSASCVGGWRPIIRPRSRVRGESDRRRARDVQCTSVFLATAAPLFARYFPSMLRILEAGRNPGRANASSPDVSRRVIATFVDSSGTLCLANNTQHYEI